MTKIDSVRAMQEYIESHLSEKITWVDLAKVSLYSPWYSYRLFQDHLNMTPSDYIRRCRLSQSAQMLRGSSMKIIDVAYLAGYDSVDGYQRAFHKEFGTNPYEYAKNPIPIGLFTPFKIYEKKEKTEVKEVKNVFISVLEKPKRKVIVKRGQKATDYWGYCEEVGCDVWGVLVSMIQKGEEPVSMWLPNKYIKEGTSLYVQGVEVGIHDKVIIPEGFDVMEHSATTYLKFQGEPFREEDYCEAIDEVQEAIERFQPTTMGYEWNHGEPRIQLEPIGERGYIELVPVLKK
ncbi:MAG: AraC family transcriptional regulator [Bacilli bacterium]|nr:AraC family transcriptional regulator [Bacilli bacterium]